MQIAYNMGMHMLLKGISLCNNILHVLSPAYRVCDLNTRGCAMRDQF